MWTDRTPPSSRPLMLAAILLVSLLAPFLGGSTEPWAQGVICVAIGACLLIFPPRYRLESPLFYWIALAFLLLPLLAFLPASWFGIPHWREALVQDFQIKLPFTATPQPWVTAECWLLLLAGLLWLVYLTCYRISNENRWKIARLYVTAVTLLAIVCLISYFLKQPLPFWHAREKFGFFPNRNQMGNWLAIGSILIPALIHQDWSRNRLWSAWWIASLAILGTALVITFSRAGILIFFAGMTLFLVGLSMQRRWTAQLVLCLVALVISLTLFLIFGGTTLARFQSSTSTTPDTPGLRWLLQHDALSMKAHTPCCGVGLGNFSAIFALHRDESRNEDRALHPESDWLWLANEVGWAALLIAWAGIFVLGKESLPLERGSARTIRLAAAVGVAAFAVHGFFDVSGHRLGSFIPICLFTTLMLHPKHQKHILPWQKTFLRTAGAIVLLAGLYWIGASLAPGLWPVRAGVEKAKRQADAALAARDPRTAISVLDPTLEWAPLEWDLYFRRAVTLLSLTPDLARMDFLRARHLEPNSPRTPMLEGLYWVRIDPANAVAAWREALSRDRHNPTERFIGIFNAAAKNARAREGVRKLSLDRPEYFLVFASHATPEEFTDMRQKLLKRDPRLDSFNRAQKQQLFTIWASQEGLPSVITAVQSTPTWKEAAGPLIAQNLAAQGQYETAYYTLHALVPDPIFPSIPPEPTENLLNRIRLHPSDFAAAYLLIRNYTAARDTDTALKVAQDIVKQPGCPPYFHFLHAHLAADSEQWKEAWEALKLYTGQ